MPPWNSRKEVGGSGDIGSDVSCGVGRGVEGAQTLGCAESCLLERERPTNPREGLKNHVELLVPTLDDGSVLRSCLCLSSSLVPAGIYDSYKEVFKITCIIWKWALAQSVVNLGSNQVTSDLVFKRSSSAPCEQFLVVWLGMVMAHWESGPGCLSQCFSCLPPLPGNKRLVISLRSPMWGWGVGVVEEEDDED